MTRGTRARSKLVENSTKLINGEISQFDVASCAQLQRADGVSERTVQGPTVRQSGERGMVGGIRDASQRDKSSAIQRKRQTVVPALRHGRHRVPLRGAVYAGMRNGIRYLPDFSDSTGRSSKTSRFDF